MGPCRASMPPGPPSAAARGVAWSSRRTPRATHITPNLLTKKGAWPPNRTPRHAGRSTMARFALLALLTGAAAFVSKRAPLPARRVAARRPTRAAMVMEDTYWEGEAPPSYVLGNLANAPSGLLGPMSGVFLLVGLYCVSASQLGSPLTAATVNPFYIAGSLCVPVSWGLHVAAWIQKKNDM